MGLFIHSITLFFLLAARAVQELLTEPSDEDEPEPALSLKSYWKKIRSMVATLLCLLPRAVCGCRYYMAMGASKIVAEPLTITGSIGVVTGKFNLEELYRRVQYSKVVISKGK